MELKIGQIFLKVRPFRNRVFEYEIKNLKTCVYEKLTESLCGHIKDFEGYSIKRRDD
jgi:hypothetical protein